MPTTINQYMIDKARQHLTHWTIRRAARLTRDVGFSYEPVSTGNPETYEDLQAEFAACMRTRRGYRVWAGASERTIYTSPEGNYAFRYIHDVFHAVHKLDFSVKGELATAQHHLREVKSAFGDASIEALLIDADTAGQVLYFEQTGQFVSEQLAFVYAHLIS